MRLEEYWGVGPKTRQRLEAELGEAAAVAAIESADVTALTDAGLSRGRATRILRRARADEDMGVLATRDARAVYRDVLDAAREYAVTRHAADRVRVLTPLADRAAARERLDRVTAAMAAWRGLDGDDRAAVLSAFEAYDSVEGGELAAVEAALALQDTGVSAGVFAPVADLDGGDLAAAADALRALEGGRIADGADDRLDALRADLAAARDLDRDAGSVLDEVRSGEVRDVDAFRAAFVEYVAGETGIDAARVRAAFPAEAADATDFVMGALRDLVADLEADAEARAAEVRADLEGTLDATGGTVEGAVEAVDDVALAVSLARFALAYDMTEPAFVDGAAVAVEGARNLGLATPRDPDTPAGATHAGDEGGERGRDGARHRDGDGGRDVQPVDYAVGDHDLAPPAGDRASVLTGANSGGKTTLLETLCQVVLLAGMGLPVPADGAAVGPLDAVVFHRRHASFNAGVLESTLRNVVPPLTRDGRTLMLVDEFEAITEPGSAADLLHGLVTLTVERDALGVFVTHLADDLAPLPDAARVDGISAEGLDEDLELSVDYQPRFGEVGTSTPEFIVSRLLADADGRAERAGFETLAGAVGETAVQRTLADARWSGGN